MELHERTALIKCGQIIKLGLRFGSQLTDTGEVCYDKYVTDINFAVTDITSWCWFGARGVIPIFPTMGLQLLLLIMPVWRASLVVDRTGSPL